MPFIMDIHGYLFFFIIFYAFRDSSKKKIINGQPIYNGTFRFEIKTIKKQWSSLVPVTTKQSLLLKLLWGCWLSGVRLLPRQQSSYVPAEEANIIAWRATSRPTAMDLSSCLKVVGVSEVLLGAKAFDFVLEQIITGYANVSGGWVFFL